MITLAESHLYRVLWSDCSKEPIDSSRGERVEGARRMWPRRERYYQVSYKAAVLSSALLYHSAALLQASDAKRGE